MQMTKTEYSPDLLRKWKAEVNESGEIEKMLNEFLGRFNSVLGNKTRAKNFEVYIKGLVSKLPRKSIEPIALKYMGESGVRTLQNFSGRSDFDDGAVRDSYQKQLGETISAGNGMLSLDGSDFVKKGKHSAGVKRQYCGRFGKVENCQAGVFAAYAGENGYGIVERELYIPQEWFEDSHAELRKKCKIPEHKMFKTKNEIALEMTKEIIGKNLFNVKWIGADASFGCDHEFIDNLPKTACYFVATNNKERVFLPGGRLPVTVKSLAENDDFPWECVGFDTSKGVRNSNVKIIRCFAARTDKKGNPVCHDEIWLYIRRFPNGDTKFSLTNAPEDMPHAELHEAATLRWPIEQCFEECKSYLGMADYEGRSYRGFLRHLLFVMIAHFFGTSLRLSLKKTTFP